MLSLKAQRLIYNLPHLARNVLMFQIALTKSTVVQNASTFLIPKKTVSDSLTSS